MSEDLFLPTTEESLAAESPQPTPEPGIPIVDQGMGEAAAAAAAETGSGEGEDPAAVARNLLAFMRNGGLADDRADAAFAAAAAASPEPRFLPAIVAAAAAEENEVRSSDEVRTIRIRVAIRNTGEVKELSVVPSIHVIGAKRIMSLLYNVGPVSRQTLTFSHRVLEGNRRLSDYRITDGCVLYLTVDGGLDPDRPQPTPEPTASGVVPLAGGAVPAPLGASSSGAGPAAAAETEEGTESSPVPLPSELTSVSNESAASYIFLPLYSTTDLDDGGARVMGRFIDADEYNHGQGAYERGDVIFLSRGASLPSFSEAPSSIPIVDQGGAAESPDDMAEFYIKVVIRNTDDILRIQVWNSMRVLILKVALRDEHNCGPIPDQVLTCAHHILEDNRTLRSYGIRDGYWLYLTVPDEWFNSDRAPNLDPCL